MPKKALITGVTGQDGAYLSRLLLSKGYEVHGIIRRASNFNTNRLDSIHQDAHIEDYNFILHYGDLADASTVNKLMRQIKPDEVYNLAAQSHVRVSFDIPEYTSDIVALGALRVLEAIKNIKEEFGKEIKFYQASSSEMFGKVQEVPQNENTPFYPRSPYGVSKVYAYWITKNYRESYNIFACNGILFNHESPIRGKTFVTRKVTRAAAMIKKGLIKKFYLGNLEAKRDWGYAGDFVQAMWLMMQKDEPDDYVIATGETHTVRELVELAFSEVGITIQWQGTGLSEKGINTATGESIIEIDPKYFRPTEVEILLGDSSKAQQNLNWKPKTTFQDLISLMVKQDHNFLDVEQEKLNLEYYQYLDQRSWE